MRRSGMIVLGLTGALVAFGIGDLEKGNRLYRAGKYAEAAAAYEAALEGGKSSPQLEYNLGTALLRLGRMQEAEQHLRAALRDVEPSLRQRTLYNLGNRYLYAARAPSAAQDQQQKLLDSAVQSYQQALRLRPDDPNAKWNLELALREQQKQQDQGGGGQQKNNQGGGSGGGGGGTGNAQGGGEDQGTQSNRSPMTQAQADRILSAAEQDERQLYRDRVKQGRRELPVARDW
ncbi:MAG TPA: tetratricopeptide repeat protein [Longimicrobiales bacterium]|nr:tetratricopeptide repeat protein [Longimicrobiales bacterium]